jgi:hypothetical protein
MTPERWSRLKDLFDQALAVDPTERPSFIELVCDGDQDLADSVRELVAWRQRTLAPRLWETIR